MTPEEAQRVSIVPSTTQTEIKVEAPPMPENLKDLKLTTEGLDNLLDRPVDQPIVKVDGKEVTEVKPEIKKEEEVLKKEGQEVPKEQPKEESVLKPPKEEKKVEESAKKQEEVKQVEKPKVEENVVSKLIKPPNVDEKGEQFDYSKYSPQIQTNLKNMSRQSREWAVELMKKNEDADKRQNGTYLQHDDAYLISPEFKQLQQNDVLFRNEHQVWQEALIAIREGKPYKQPIGRDKNGNLVMSSEQQPTPQDQVRVETNVNLCANAIRKNETDAQGMMSSYKQRIGTDLQAIEAERKERFGWVADPKMFDYTVQTDSGEKSLKQIHTDFQSIWPSYLRDTPGTKVACDLFVALTIRNAELKALKTKLGAAELRTKEAARGEIKPEATPSAKDLEQHYKVNGVDVPKTFSLDNMPI